ncbi:MAG: hypothetical protein BroJett018_14540 [Chloroflexota bacterium]|nr:hypothetical protein [Chloroflexota bacterium]NOG65184.1 hypothetical protein [Chloroflexota bacterium]GIK63660.1 MAG: hypothetical protein BroJett018_14540 [Chloroflexota bacterium]
MTDLRDALDQLRHDIQDLPPSPTSADTAELEKIARELLAQSKNTAYEDEARELFSLLARLSAPSSASAESNQIRGLLRRARIRIEIAGDDHDFDEAIDILAQALDLDPGYVETHDLLMQAAQHSPQHAIKVQGLLDRYGLVLNSEDETETPVPPPAAPTKRAETAPPPPPKSADMASSGPADALLSEIASAYYAGDYARTVDLANRLLATDPNNAQAAEYRQKADDNMMRGVVPDHRIPFDARVAYNRANSLVRAGNYDEAQRLYREARDIAERAGIPSWKDVEQALLEIQDLALARELLADGDRLLMADDWGGALAKYEGALRVVPNDPEGEERVALVREVQQQYDQANVQMNMLSGSLLKRAKGLTDLLNMASRIRQKLPGSERLQAMVYETNSRIQNIKAQLIAQGEGALGRIEAVTAVEEKLRLVDEAIEALRTAVELDAADPKAMNLLQQAQQFRADLGEGRQVMERAAALIAQNFDNELAQARQMLSGLRHQAQDPRYRMLVADLLSRHLERVEVAIDRRDAATAERWLAIAKEEPFRILGRRTEILKLEDEVRGLRQGRIIRRVALGGVALLILGAVLVLSRDAWEPIVNPPPTDTPQPTDTLTPSNTPTATSTASVTPTATPQPSDQTATAGVIQTRIVGTQQSVDAITQTAEGLVAGQTATSRFIDEQATISFNATSVQSTLIMRTEQAQATVNYFNTQTATYQPPSPTIRPSETNTPTATATVQEVLCRVGNASYSDGINVRTSPSVGTVITRMQFNQAADVLAQQMGDQNRIWFKIRYVLGSATVEGWIQSDLVLQLTPCPQLNN